MSNNIFSKKRFLLLFRQHFIQNSQLLWLSAVAYVGVIFIVLSIAQVGSELEPHGLNSFQAFLVAFVTVFGILYAGHAFPAFRSKENTINYLMMPASVLEKFLFEFVNRIVITLVTLPVLFWVTFNVQGYFFGIFTEGIFEPIGIQYLVRLDDLDPEQRFLIYALITGGILFALSLAFTGSAMFDKQPLVKSLFAVAVIVAFYVGYAYVVAEHLGLGRYQPPEEMLLVPVQEGRVLTFIASALFAGTVVMLLVAFRKLKEREV